MTKPIRPVAAAAALALAAVLPAALVPAGFARAQAIRTHGDPSAAAATAGR